MLAPDDGVDAHNVVTLREGGLRLLLRAARLLGPAKSRHDELTMNPGQRQEFDAMLTLATAAAAKDGGRYAGGRRLPGRQWRPLVYPFSRGQSLC